MGLPKSLLKAVVSVFVLLNFTGLLPVPYISDLLHSVPPWGMCISPALHPASLLLLRSFTFCCTPWKGSGLHRAPCLSMFVREFLPLCPCFYVTRQGYC